MYKTRTRFLTVGAAALLLLLPTGCGSSSESSGTALKSGSSASDLVKAAKSESTVTLYTTATAGPAQMQADAFTAKYGISTRMVRLTGSQMDQRFRAETNSSGGTGADIIFTTNPVLISDAVESGDLVALEKANLPNFPGNFPERFLMPDEGTAVTLIQPAAIAYNTDLVEGDDIPKGWPDLLDPKWKGKIGIASPTSALGYVGEWVVIGNQEGGNYLSELGTQELKVFAAGSTLTGALGAGEIAIAADSLVTNTVPDMKKGAPIDYVVPENTSGIELSVGIVNKSQHPNAARLFAEYAMSKEGAEVLAKASDSVSPYNIDDLPKMYEGADIAGAPKMLSEIQRLLRVK